MDLHRIGIEQVHIASNEMEAFLTLPKPLQGMPYTFTEVMDGIRLAGVTYGIQTEIVQQMINNCVYDREILIARGDPAEDGIDGEYSFQFNLAPNNKPEIRSDGSVDYWNVHSIELVEEGQVIATYTEPTLGKNGATVKGKILLAKRGRPQPPLLGKGFERSEDGKVYTATTAGKIEKKDNRIQISAVYEVFGDVDLHTGNIEFRGDVIVHGNVSSGAIIQATGSITIDGTAEACQIIAGKDVIMRGGMLGAHKGMIKCKGNLYARFIEYATVEVEGFIDASSALCCNITCYDQVKMSGKQANIIGGYVYGVRGVEAACIGNQKEVQTEIQTGVSKELMAEYVKIENQLSNASETIKKINEGLQQFDEYAKQMNVDMRNDERRVALMRTRIMKQAEMSKGQEEQNRLKMILENGKGATVRVIHEVHPGVKVVINTSIAKLQNMQKQVEFIERGGKVIMTSLEDDLVG